MALWLHYVPCLLAYLTTPTQCVMYRLDPPSVFSPSVFSDFPTRPSINGKTPKRSLHIAKWNVDRWNTGIQIRQCSFIFELLHSAQVKRLCMAKCVVQPVSATLIYCCWWVDIFSVEDSKNLTCIFPAENSCFFRSQSLHIYMVALCLTYDPVSINDLSQTFSISGQQRKHLNFHGNALLPQSSLLPWQSLNAELMGVRQRTLMACTRSWPSQLKQLSFFLPTSRFLPFLPCRHFDRISLCGSLEWKQLCVISCCI